MPVARSLCLAVLLALCPALAWPCATAPRPGERVDLAQEEAILVWDPDTRTEHFIRRAVFGTEAQSFGFLVPTPTRPEVAEADDAAFDRLAQAILPRQVTETRTEVIWAPLLGALVWLGASPRGTARAIPDAGVSPAAVTVLERKKVAGYDVAVLEATDPTALAGWLRENGFASTPTLQEWAAPYVQKGWKFTAFRYDGESLGELATGAVRLSFQTPSPFFPYREPASQPQEVPAPRLLRVYLLTSERNTGVLGGEWPRPWKVWHRFSASVEEPVLEGLPYRKSRWLDVYEDSQSPRPGTDDLFFGPSADPRAIVPAPEVRTVTNRIPVPLDLLALLAAWWFIARRRRRG